jgi:hypothetical protein
MNQCSSLDRKVCTVCKLEQDFGCFAKQKLARNGVKASCKLCDKQYRIANKDKISDLQSKYYQENRDKIIKRTKEWYASTIDQRRLNDKKRYVEIRSNPERLLILREIMKKGSKKYKNKHPEREKARSAVRRAIKSGKLTRPQDCSFCGCECKPDAHHDSYDVKDWLNVRWLCDNCHATYHRKHSDQPK